MIDYGFGQLSFSYLRVFAVSNKRFCSVKIAFERYRLFQLVIRLSGATLSRVLTYLLYMQQSHLCQQNFEQKVQKLCTWLLFGRR